MHNSVDLNPYIQFGITVIVLIFGLIYLVKNTAAKYFVVVDGDGDDSVNSNSTCVDSGVVLNLCSMPGLVSSSEPCVVCGNLTKKKCSRCKVARYCSAPCQISHWFSGHKDKCEDYRLSCNSTLQGRRNSSAVSLVPASRISSQLKKVLFPYDKFVELFNWKQQGFPPCGLQNCGNSCFANVVLQCLAFTRPLAAYLLEKGHRRECRRNDWCFLCELQAHMERASHSNYAFSPINILSRLPNIGGNLGYGKQEDAHEFMRFVIDTMQSVCLDEYGGERAVHPSSQETTLIQHIFGGRLQSQVICTKCNNVSNQFENMMDLTVEIHGDAASLEECLDQFTAKEWLDGDNKYKCDGCNDYVLAWKRLNINMAPNILTVALKRFQSGRFGKLNKRVTFPETLDLSPYMSEAADDNDKYNLYAVVVHVDMLNASYFGHYICYTKDFSGNWYRIDDCKVETVELDEVLSQGAYMLLYSRVSARPSCLNPIEESSSKDEGEASNASQEKTTSASQPSDSSLAAESDGATEKCDSVMHYNAATEKCDTVMHNNALSANASTSQNSSDSTRDLHTSDSMTSCSVSGDNGDDSIEYTVAIEKATLPVDDWCTEDDNETYIPISIQSDVSDNIEDMMGISHIRSTNGEEANGMDSVNLECESEKPILRTPMKEDSEKPVKPTSAPKLKPLLSPGFLGKRPRPRKILNTKKDEKALEPKQVNGDVKPCFKNNDIAPVVMVNGGGSNEVGKDDVCLVK